MYDRANLPLSPKKVMKKSLPGFLGFIVLGIASIAFGIFILRSSELKDISQFGGYFLYGGIFISVIFSACVLLYEYLYYKFYDYKFEDSMAEIRKGVITQAAGHVYYKKIQSVYVDQDFLDRVFGLYDVHYETAGEKSGFYSHVDGLVKENKDKLVLFLNEQITSLGGGTRAATSANQTIPTPKIKDDPSIPAMTRENCPISSKIIPVNAIGTAISIVVVVAMITAGIFSKDTGPGPKNFGLLLFLVLATSLLIGLITSFVWYNNFQFRFDSQKGEIFTRVIAQNTSYLYYDRIQNVNVSQGVIGRIFNLSEVRIETAGETSSNTLVVPGLNREDAASLKNFLLSKSEQFSKTAL